MKTVDKVIKGLMAAILCVMLLAGMCACVEPEENTVNNEVLAESGEEMSEVATSDVETCEKESEAGTADAETNNVSQWLVENPGKLVDVSNYTDEGNTAIVDLDMDGIEEEITLRSAGDEHFGYSELDHHELLLNGTVVVDAYVDNTNDNIWAISLDGRANLIVLYADGPSEDPYTRFYAYEGGTLVEIGSFGTDIRYCEITEDGTIHGIIRTDVVHSSSCHVSWHLNEQNRLEIVEQDAYDFAWTEEVKLLKELTLYAEPGSSESFVVAPQAVTLLQVTGDEKWVLLEAADGSRGWFPVDLYTIVEYDEYSENVFAGLQFYG